MPNRNHRLRMARKRLMVARERLLVSYDTWFKRRDKTSTTRRSRRFNYFRAIQHRKNRTS